MEEIFSLASYTFRWLVLPQIIFAALILMLGLFGYSQNTRSPVNRSFLYLTLAEALWLGGFGLAYLGNSPPVALWWFRVGYIGVIFIPTTAYLFSVRYTNAHWQGLIAQAALAASFGYAMLSPVLSTGLYRYPWGDYLRLGRANVPFVLMFVLMAAMFLANMYGPLRIAPTTRERRIHAALLAVTGLAYLGAIDFLPAYGIWLPVPPLGFIPNAIFVSAMGYLLLRHRLLEIRTLLHRTIGYAVFTIMIALLYGSVYAAIQWVTRRDADWRELLGSFLLFATLLYLFAPLKEATKRMVELIFDRQLVNVRERVNRFVSRLQQLTDLPRLERDIINLMTDDFHAASCRLLVREAGGGAYVVRQQRPGRQRDRRTTFPTATWQGVLTALEHGGQVVTREQLLADPAYQSIRSAGVAFFDRLQAELIVPLVSQGKLVACLALGHKRHGTYSTEDVKLLTVLSGALAVALENTTLIHRLQEVGQMKSNFVTVATHQLRTPLSETKWALAAVREDATSLTDRQRQLLEHAQATNERMIKLTNLLQTLTSGGPAGTEQLRQAFDLGRLVRATAAQLATLASVQRVTITVNAQRSATINADREKIGQVIAALLDNAIRYNRPDGTVKVTVASDGELVTCEIRDSGIGIPATDRAQLFTAFFRASNAGRQYTEGIGLSLYFAQQILRAHGSELYFRVRGDSGSTFSFSLPTAAT